MEDGLALPVAVVLGLWVAVTTACSPVVRARQIRELMDRGPFPSHWLNYGLLTSAIVLGHAVTFFAGIVLTGGFHGDALLYWTLLVAAGYPLLLGGLAVLAIHGSDRWRQDHDGADARLVLGLAAVWYALVTVTIAIAAAILLFAWYYPG